MSGKDDECTPDAADDLAIGAETSATVEASREHAADLIAAAKLIQEQFPHLAYHFAVLALEEIGRGVLLVVRHSVAESGDERRALDDGMEDHVRKLFWALWSPTQADPVTGTQIDEFRELARQIHEVRKSGLYFDPTVATLPREAVSTKEANTVIGLAEARLGIETTRRWVAANSQQEDDVRWFGTATSDPTLRAFIFGGPSLKKLSELRSVPAWIRWLRVDVETADRNAQDALARELARTKPGGGEALEEKWRMKFRIFSESHSVRAGPLATWNERNQWLELRRATSNELVVQLKMPKLVLAGAVWPGGYYLAQRLLLALNIATFGFFWWRRFNRHNTAHRITPTQWTEANALSALMLTASLLREIDHWVKLSERRGNP